MSKTINIVKIALVIISLIFLARLSYGFIEFARSTVFLGLAFYSYRSNTLGSRTEMFYFIAVAIIYQPFYKIPIDDADWSLLNTIIQLGTVIVVFRSMRLNQ